MTTRVYARITTRITTRMTTLVLFAEPMSDAFQASSTSS